MEKKELNIDRPVTVAGVTLIPVSEVSLSHWHHKRGIFYSGSKQPVSVVIISPSVKKAFRITGEEITLDQLVHEVPNIKEMLEETWESMEGS